MELSEIVMPKKGDELFEGLVDIFKGERGLWNTTMPEEFGITDESEKDEYYIEEGLSEALSHLKYVEPFHDSKKEHPPMSVGSYILMWVLLKTQQYCGVEENKRANKIMDDFKGRDFNLEEKHCVLFRKCEELVARITSPEAAFEKASESLQFALANVKNAQKKVRDLRGAVKRGNEKIESQKNRIALLEAEGEQLKKEQDRLQEKMNSVEFRDEVGREYIKKVFEEYLKDADEMEQSLRKDWFNVLQGFCSIEGVPKEVKKMIQSLKRKPKGSDGMTVNTQTYVETQNNNYK